MQFKFTKMEGCGNDYIYFNCLEQPLPHPEELSIRLSDRHFGIGGDGIILICPSDVADAKMRMFNADGSEGKMCGNAIRCVGKYLYDNKIVLKDVLEIDTLSGIKVLNLSFHQDKVDTVRVYMGQPIITPSLVPVSLPGDRIINRIQKIGADDYAITCVSMGNPHCVVYYDTKQQVEELDLPKIGPLFEKHEIFPEQVNTEFIHVIDDKTLHMRVWERGSGETLACGTGACAAVVSSVLNGFCKMDTDITVHLRGGDLVIRYTDEGVYMTGKATKVFDGILDI